MLSRGVGAFIIYEALHAEDTYRPMFQVRTKPAYICVYVFLYICTCVYTIYMYVSTNSVIRRNQTHAPCCKPHHLRSLRFQ